MPINEATIRLGVFIGVFTAMASWEAAAPRRLRSYSRSTRWPSNLAIVVLNTGLVRILLSATAVSLAALGEQRGWGLLNIRPLPVWSRIIASVILLDLAIYLQHVMFHAVPVLWRVHRMYHVDLEFDVTTGARFHPIEIILSMLIKFGVIAAIGASAAGVLIFEVLLNATSMFNLGFNLPWWDRLLGTYRDHPTAGHEGMTIGIEQFRESRELWLDRMLLQPFRGPTGSYPITWRRAA